MARTPIIHHHTSMEEWQSAAPNHSPLPCLPPSLPPCHLIVPHRPSQLVLGCPQPAQCDSVMIAGLMDLLATHGQWMPSFRLAFHQVNGGDTKMTTRDLIFFSLLSLRHPYFPPYLLPSLPSSLPIFLSPLAYVFHPPYFLNRLRGLCWNIKETMCKSLHHRWMNINELIHE